MRSNRFKLMPRAVCDARSSPASNHAASPDDEADDSAGEADPLDYELGAFSYATNESSLTLQVDAAAWQGIGSSSVLYLVSATGSHTAVKAVAAAMSIKNGSGRFYLYVKDQLPRTQITRAGNKWRVFKHRLGYNTWQMLAVAENPCLLAKADEASLWRRLRSDVYTTPILRAWMPWLSAELSRLKLLSRFSCFRCDAAMLNLPPEKLDELVSTGVKQGELRIA